MNQRGFTLIEVLLSISVIVLLGGLSMPVYQSLQMRNDLDVAVSTVTQTMRRAQVLSQAVSGDEKWGVRSGDGSITLFSGESYVNRNEGFDEVFSIPSTIKVSGLQQVVYSKVFGTPDETGEILLTSDNGEVRTIMLNEKGTISF